MAVYNLEVAGAHTYFVEDGLGRQTPLWVHNDCCFPRDFRSKRTIDLTIVFSSEREARAFARAKVGRKPVEVELHKLRSRNGKWQYRAKPSDIADHHVHLEEIDPRTGEVLRNLHLRWGAA